MSERRFDIVDFRRLPQPDAIEVWTYQGILDARIAKVLELWAALRALDPTLPQYDVETLRSDPAIICQEVDAFREALLRQRVNDAARATHLPFAAGADLDARAAGVSTLRAPGESDDSLRLRAMLAFENLSIGGSYGGYEYQARAVAPSDIADVVVYGHETDGVALGEVRVMLLGAAPSGVVTPALVDRVQAQLSRRDIRKVNDRIVVQAAQIAPYAIEATLVVGGAGIGPQVRDAKIADMRAFAAQRRRIGAAVTYNGVMQALGDDDPSIVVDIEMRAPFAGRINVAAPPRIGGGPFAAPVCTSIALDWRYA